MRRNKGILSLALSGIFILAPCVRAGDLTAGRLARPGDTTLVKQLAAAHIVREDPFAVLAVTPSPETADASDLYIRGVALSMTGRHLMAAESFKKAMSASEPASDLYRKAALQFLKMTAYDTALDLPAAQDLARGTTDPDLALYLSGYFAGKGDRGTALAILERTTFTDERSRTVSGILKAGHIAATESFDASARSISKVRPTGSPALADLVYLEKGYHYLSANQPDRARTSFDEIDVAGPYGPEALLGGAWSHINASDLPGAAVALEELVERYRYSRAAREGTLDLALVYRDLGLYNKATSVIEDQLARLREVSNWLLEIREDDLSAGSDLVTVLEGVVNGIKPPQDKLLQTPVFALRWIEEAASDPYVMRTTDLLKGTMLLEEKAARVRGRLDKDIILVRAEMDRVGSEITRARERMARLYELRNQLDYIRNGISSTLQTMSLNTFASEKAMLLIRKTGELRLRLALMENSAKRSEGFTPLVKKLEKSVTTSEEEKQLNRLRKQAYDGLISSRLTMRRLGNSLAALEGKLWFEVKKEAIELERRVSLRVTSGRTRAGQAIADTSRTLQLLAARMDSLNDLHDLILTRKNYLDEGYTAGLSDLSDQIASARSARLLGLAESAAREIRETQARILFTMADIEVTRMEDTMRALREAVD